LTNAIIGKPRAGRQAAPLDHNRHPAMEISSRGGLAEKNIPRSRPQTAIVLQPCRAGMSERRPRDMAIVSPPPWAYINRPVHCGR